MSVAAAKVLRSTLGMTEEEFAEARGDGLGGSDAAAVFGLSQWKSPMELYAEKVHGMTKEATWAMKRGIALEQPLAEWFAETMGVKVWRKNAILYHQDYPFMRANIDRRVVGVNENIGVEIKTASPFASEKWKDGDAPIDYVIQCQHYMAVTGWNQWWLVYCIDGREPDAILLQRDEQVIDRLIKAESAFWHNHVLPKIPPTPDHTDSCKRALSFMYRNVLTASSVELDDEADVWIEMKHEAARQMAEAKETEQTAKNRLMAMLGGNEVGLRNGQVVVTWKANKKGVRSLRVVGGDDE